MQVTNSQFTKYKTFLRASSSIEKRRNEINMGEYLLLLKVSPGKVIDVLDNLRNLPSKPSDGIDLDYTMNIFGTWDVGIWFKANKHEDAVGFLQSKIRDISGVTETYTVPTFPNQK